jgi:hypothetical protein
LGALIIHVNSTNHSCNVPAGLNGKMQREQFSVRAQAMSVRMHQVAERIQELTRLARQTTMFDDNSTQISQLTAQVKHGLQGLVCLLVATSMLMLEPASGLNNSEL